MYVKVHVYAGMKKDSITKTADATYEIVTKAPARGNHANKRVIDVMAREYGVTPAQVRIVNGHHHPRKLLEVIQSE